MKVLPISNNNINLQEKQKSPNFQARINPEVLAQLKGRTKPVKDMIVKSVAGIISVPTATAAAYFLNHTDANENINELISAPDSEIKEFGDIELLKNVSSGNLYSVVTMQDKEGETILHQGFNLDTLNFLRENLSDKEFVAALSIKDDTYYLSAAGGYEGDIEYAITSPDFASLSLENTIELLSNIDANSNIIDFLKTRLEKEYFVGKPLSAAINKELCSHIMASKVSTDVETKNVVFEDLNLGTIAELFEIDKDDTGYLKLDSKYLPIASLTSLSDIMFSALRTAPILVFEELYNAINKIEDEDEKAEVLAKALLNNLELLDNERLEFIYNKSGLDMYKKIFKIDDNDGNTIFHMNGFDLRQPEVASVWTNFKQRVSSDFVADVMSMKNDEGNTPLHSDSTLTAEVIKCFDKEDSVIIKNLLVSKNNEGYAVIQTSSSMELLSDIFRKLDGKEDVLADILLAAIDQTSHEELYSFEECEALKAKILELATDSDLSIEKSIQLLESSGLEPQVLEYLKLQQQASNNQ